MSLWLPMGQLVHLLGLELKFGALVESVITLVIQEMLFGPKAGFLVHFVGDGMMLCIKWGGYWATQGHILSFTKIIFVFHNFLSDLCPFKTL